MKTERVLLGFMTFCFAATPLSALAENSKRADATAYFTEVLRGFCPAQSNGTREAKNCETNAIFGARKITDFVAPRMTSHETAWTMGVVIGFGVAFCAGRLLIAHAKDMAPYSLLPRDAANCAVSEFIEIDASALSISEAAAIVTRMPASGSAEFIKQSMRFDDAYAMLRYYKRPK